MKTLQWMMLLATMAAATSTVSMAQEQPRYDALDAKLKTTKPSVLPESLVRLDLNGDTMSMVKVWSELEGLTFTGNLVEQDGQKWQRLERSSGRGYEYRMYVTGGTRNIRIGHNAFHPTTLDFSPAVGRNELWEVEVVGLIHEKAETVEVSDADNTLPVTIQTDSFAELYIDKEFQPDKSNIRVAAGRHSILVKYGDVEDEQSVNIKKGNQVIEAKLGGTLIVRKAVSVNVSSLGPSPKANFVKRRRHKVVYDGLLGSYYVSGVPTGWGEDLSYSRKISISPRSSNTITLFPRDEMYRFNMFHGTDLAPIFGFNWGICKKFGGFLSMSYWDNGEEYEEGSGEDKTYDSENTYFNISSGMMYDLARRKLFLQAGIGYGCYSHHIGYEDCDLRLKRLTADVELLYRMGWFVFGLGYKRMIGSIPEGYPIRADQLSFSIGWTRLCK